MKNILIDLLIILLTCLNIAYTYSILFCKEWQFSSIIPDISASSFIVSLSSTITSIWSLWSLFPILSLINLNAFWINWILNLDYKKMLYIVLIIILSVIYTLLPQTIFILPTLFVCSSFFPIRYVIYICSGICSINRTITLKLFTCCQIWHKIVQYIMYYRTIRYLVIS